MLEAVMLVRAMQLAPNRTLTPNRTSFLIAGLAILLVAPLITSWEVIVDALVIVAWLFGAVALAGIGAIVVSLLCFATGAVLGCCCRLHGSSILKKLFSIGDYGFAGRTPS